ncbi:hypothetical protein C8R47DRAFT_1295125 [Mycena vitilis]|nr:hypothetical protein C8R47DRAFT_1295125 [Mycena vitilis]
MASTPRLLVIGAGFAGLWAARKRELAGKADQVEIVLIAPEPTLYLRPALYENDVSTAFAPLAELLTVVGVRYVQGLVQHIATDEKRVEYTSADGASTLRFDRLILASGSQLFRPEAVAGIAEYSFDADQMEGALKLDAHLKSLAALPDSPERNTVVVCGGGFTGTEMAAEMPARLRSILGEGADVKVIMLESGDSVNFMGPKSSHVVQEALASLHVETLAGQTVVSIDAEGVVTASGTRLASKTPLTAQISAKRDELERLFVTQDLKVVGFDHIFATGDTAHVATDEKGHLALQSCQHATALGKAAGNNAMADLLDLPLAPYSQPFYATCLALGPWGALFTKGWDREVNLVREAGHALKKEIITKVIHPPAPNKAEAFAAADPAVQLIA